MRGLLKSISWKKNTQKLLMVLRQMVSKKQQENAILESNREELQLLIDEATVHHRPSSESLRPIVWGGGNKQTKQKTPRNSFYAEQKLQPWVRAARTATSLCGLELLTHSSHSGGCVKRRAKLQSAAPHRPRDKWFMANACRRLMEVDVQWLQRQEEEDRTSHLFFLLMSCG